MGGTFKRHCGWLIVPFGMLGGGVVAVIRSGDVLNEAKPLVETRRDGQTGGVNVRRSRSAFPV